MLEQDWLAPGIFTVEGVFSARECAAAIARAEAVGFDDAPITRVEGPVMDRRARDNRRVMEDDPALADFLWERIESVAPGPIGESGPNGLNERFRTYRYDPGHFFAPHRDGAYRRPNGDRSYWTMMVYLNEGFVGGETRFVLADHTFIDVVPRTGLALFFFHPEQHEGRAVVEGRKYVLRTDVMYPALTS